MNPAWNSLLYIEIGVMSSYDHCGVIADDGGGENSCALVWLQDANFFFQTSRNNIFSHINVLK
jgi:hypothetical protein